MTKTKIVQHSSYVDPGTPIGKRQEPTCPDVSVWDELSAPFERDNDGLPIEKGKAKKSSQRKWYPPKKSGPRRLGDITVARTAVTVSGAVIKALGSDYAVPGIDVIDGENVLLFMASEKGKGYKLSPDKMSSGGRITGKKLIAKMIADGLECGPYKAKKVKGGVIAWPIKEK